MNENATRRIVDEIITNSNSNTQQEEPYWDPDQEVEIFSKETIAKLLQEEKLDEFGKPTGQKYTMKEIMDAKKEGERLLRLADYAYSKKVEINKNGQSFIQVYNLVDLTKIYNCEEIEDFRKMCSNEKEGHVLSSLVHLNNYKLQGRDRNEMVIVSGLNYYKSMIKLYDKFNSFHISNECVQKMKEMISYWSIPKNESKKKRIRIKASILPKKLKKYNLEIGQVFESQKDLAEYCGITLAMVNRWKKCYYIEEIK